MLGILKKNEAGYIRGVMDHLGRDDTEMVFDETGLEKEKAKEKKCQTNVVWVETYP